MSHDEVRLGRTMTEAYDTLSLNPRLVLCRPVGRQSPGLGLRACLDVPDIDPAGPEIGLNSPLTGEPGWPRHKALAGELRLEVSGPLGWCGRYTP